jgi:hypothetical protein
MTSDRRPDPRDKFTWHPETREDHLADLCDVATRPWPLSTPDAVAERAHKIYSAIGDESFRVLVGFIVTPPRPEEHWVVGIDDFDEARAECVATAIGDRADRLAQVCGLLVPEATRDKAIDALLAFSFPFNAMLTKQWRRNRDDALPLLAALLRRVPALPGDTRDLVDLVELIENRRRASASP